MMIYKNQLYSNYLLYLLYIFNIFLIKEYSSSSIKFGKYGSVSVDYNRPLDQQWGSAWPDGIRLRNNVQVFPTAIKFHNVTGYPYAQQLSRPVTSINHQRTYTWIGDDLIIYCSLSEVTTNPSCSRLAPPQSWLTINGAKVQSPKMFKQSSFITNLAITNSSIAIQVPKSLVEKNLGILRANSFTREDIYRMLDKGPWILSFDITKSLMKLFLDLQTALGLNQTQSMKVVSHNPYLLAQYTRYPGRDVCATVKELLDVGYSNVTLIEDVIRFPNILSTPPERIRGWLNFLQHYNIAKCSKLYGKMLRRSPFMFHLDPPNLFDNTYQSNDAIKILDLLYHLKIPDLDKVIRSQPSILLCSIDELYKRINFLISLFSITPPIRSLDESIDDVVSTTDLFSQGYMNINNNIQNIIDRSNKLNSNDENALNMFHDLLQTYPGVISIDYEQMRAVGNAMRAGGLKRSDIVYLIRRYPATLERSPELLQNLLIFLVSYCGFRKIDIVPFLSKYPSLLVADIDELQPKVDYLYQSLGGTPAALRRFPAYLSYNLEEHIKPRSEFLRTFNVNPIEFGLSFFLTSSHKDLANSVGVSIDVFRQFCLSYSKLTKKSKKVLIDSR